MGLAANGDATYQAIGGYTPLSNVVQPSLIDLDMIDLENYIGDYQWSLAYAICT